jgi:hypothetical protein
MHPTQKPQKPAPQNDKQKRLSEALRANLKRRKTPAPAPSKTAKD